MNDANAYAARTSAGGSGWTRSRAPTMIAERAFGADEELREVGPDRGARRAAGRDERAVGEHDVEAGRRCPRSCRSAVESWPGAAAREPAADGRQRHRLRPVPARDAVLGAELVLEHVAERAGQHVDEHRRRGRRRRCPSSAVRSSSTPPNTGTLAPHTPLRPAAAVTGTRASLHSRSTAATSSAECGRTTDGRARGDLVVERPDHRERPPVAARLATISARRVDVGAGRREAAAQRVVDLDAPARRAGRVRRPRRSRTRSAASARPGSVCIAVPRQARRYGGSRAARRARSRAARRVAVRPRRALGSARPGGRCSAASQPSSAAISAGDVVGGVRPTRRARAAGPGCGGRARRRPCAPSRRAPRRRPRPACTAGRARSVRRASRSSRASASTLACVAAVPRRRTVARELRPRPSPSAPCSVTLLGAAAAAARRARSTISSTASAAMRR